MTADERTAWHAQVTAMCKAQGVPVRVTDPAILARLAAIVTTSERTAS